MNALPHRRWPNALLATILLLLGSCGGGRDRREPALQDPSVTVADAVECQRSGSREGLVGWRTEGERCRRSFLGLSSAPGAGKAAPASAPDILAATPRKLTATELFDWAEVAYREFFPSRRQNQILFPYVYRYYPETGNHVAVAGELVYVQGPLSGGALLYVGTMAEYTCTVNPDVCAGIRPCAAPTAWSAGNQTCTPNADQPRQLASGSLFTFVDTSGSATGNASYGCVDGTLTVRETPACEATPPRACNTDSLQWVVGGQLCRPNAGEPTQLDAGGRHTFKASVITVGAATYRCDDGLLVAEGAASCSLPAAPACAVAPVSWTVDSQTCQAAELPSSVADGARFDFVDNTAPTLGRAGFTCRAGVLQADAGATCTTEARLVDSFGGDGGAADGGAAGDGSAADGAPIVGGLVRAVDLNGRSASATTDARGYFRLRLTGMTPPLLVSVTRPDGKVRRSLSLRPLRPNGYTFMAVTGLTDKIVSDLAVRAGFSSPAALTPAMLDRLRDAVAERIEALRADPLVHSRLLAAGLDPARFDPLHTPFRPDGRGYDAVLDNLLVDSDETGATVLRSADCAAPMSWTVDGVTCTPDPGAETVVPSGASIVQHDTQGSTRGAVGYACSKGVLSRPLLARCGSS